MVMYELYVYAWQVCNCNVCADLELDLLTTNGTVVQQLLKGTM